MLKSVTDTATSFPGTPEEIAQLQRMQQMLLDPFGGDEKRLIRQIDDNGQSQAPIAYLYDLPNNDFCTPRTNSYWTDSLEKFVKHLFSAKHAYNQLNHHGTLKAWGYFFWLKGHGNLLGFDSPQEITPDLLKSKMFADWDGLLQVSCFFSLLNEAYFLEKEVYRANPAPRYPWDNRIFLTREKFNLTNPKSLFETIPQEGAIELEHRTLDEELQRAYSHYVQLKIKKSSQQISLAFDPEETFLRISAINVDDLGYIATDKAGLHPHEERLFSRHHPVYQQWWDFIQKNSSSTTVEAATLGWPFNTAS